MSDKGGTCLAERVEHIVSKDLNIISCTGSSNNNCSKTVDRRLDHHICNIEYGTLDPGRKPDPEDLEQAVLMDPEFTELNPDPFLCAGQADKQDQRTGQVGDHSRNRNTVYAHLKNNDKEQV